MVNLNVLQFQFTERQTSVKKRNRSRNRNTSSAPQVLMTECPLNTRYLTVIFIVHCHKMSSLLPGV